MTRKSHSLPSGPPPPRPLTAYELAQITDLERLLALAHLRLDVRAAFAAPTPDPKDPR